MASPSLARRLDAATRAAGHGDAGWNRRFRRSIAALGLALADGAHKDALAAPTSHRGPDGWPPQTVIVEVTPWPK